MDGTKAEKDRTKHELILGAIVDLRTQTRNLNLLTEEICGESSVARKPSTDTPSPTSLSQFLAEASDEISGQARTIYETTQQIRSSIF